MITTIESFVRDILQDYSVGPGEWKFSEFYGKDGNTKPQTKRYGNDGRRYSYPDYEYYNENQLSLLVELKAYDNYFNGRKYVLAMRERQFDSYMKVAKEERINVRICFGIWEDDDFHIYWETVNKLNRMKDKSIQLYTSEQKNMKTGKWEEITENYVYWSVTDFREDYWNLPVI